MTSRSSLLSLAFVVATGCSKADAPEAKPAFQPGPEAEHQLAELGGLSITVPDNLKISESAGSVELEAEGFPTVTITRNPGRYTSTGTRAKVSMGDVTVRYAIPSSEWTCTAEDAGDHAEFVVEICESMRAPVNPNVSEMLCKTVDGFDADPVTAAWSGVSSALRDCLRSTDKSGVAFGFNYELEGDARHFTSYTSPILHDAEASKCLAAIYDGLEESAAFHKDEGGNGQIECDGIYSRF
jgi:hypothetical protein